MNNNSNSAVKASEMTKEQMIARIAELEAQAEAKKNRKLTFAISENKGGLVVSGWNIKFPLSMYLSQFDRLRSQWDELCAFVDKYRAHFATKEGVWDAKVSLAGLPESAISRIKTPKTPAAKA